MAFTWNDIQNNENALSIRNKLNTLGATVSSESQTTDALEAGVGELTTKVIALQQVVKVATNIECPVAQWYDDSVLTYAEYPYKADLYISGVTADMIPLVNFNATDQASGNFIGADSATNVVTIWAKDKPSSTMTIPNVVLLKEAN